jgi:hypothetical protein
MAMETAEAAPAITEARQLHPVMAPPLLPRYISSISCFTVGLPLFLQEGLMNRDLLVNSVLSHVRKLVDPYGQ